MYISIYLWLWVIALSTLSCQLARSKVFHSRRESFRVYTLVAFIYLGIIQFFLFEYPFPVFMSCLLAHCLLFVVVRGKKTDQVQGFGNTRCRGNRTRDPPITDIFGLFTVTRRFDVTQIRHNTVNLFGFSKIRPSKNIEDFVIKITDGHAFGTYFTMQVLNSKRGRSGFDSQKCIYRWIVSVKQCTHPRLFIISV